MTIFGVNGLKEQVPRIMKILLTGAHGQLGNDCLLVLAGEHQITARSSRELDIADCSAVEQVIGQLRPEVIVNCAAFTKVDACETEYERAWKVNVGGPANLARCLKRYGGLLVHISTDYVFDGSREVPLPYNEDDPPSPLSCYGRTKLEGEHVIQDIIDHALIVRTAWVYGIKGHNFLKTMLTLALQNPKKTIRVVNDQYGSPTWSYRLAQQLAKLIHEKKYGVYHATAEGYCTWYDAARYFLTQMDIPHTIEPCSTREYPTPAVRPRNSILENRRLKQDGIDLMCSWHSDLDQFIASYRHSLLGEAMGMQS